MLAPALLLVLLAIGLASGLVMSLVGASAVMIIVPLLDLVLGYRIHTAIGISLLVDVIASLAVGYTYYRHGNVDLRQGLWISLGSILGAQLGSSFTVVLPDMVMGVSYSLWMLVAGYTIWTKGMDRTNIAGRFIRFMSFESVAQRVAVSLGLGLLIGLNAGVFGAGGGILIMLVLMFVLDYPIHSAVGTSTVIMAVTAASAALGYWRLGNIDLTVGVIISVGTISGGVGGASLANKVTEGVLSKVVGGIFLSLGVLMALLRLL